nr:ATP-binding protein [Paenibacillus xerothermodurans]
MKHTPAEAAVELHFHIDHGGLLVKAQDGGSGIDPAGLPFIFDRFYKKDKSRNSAAGGSGLGLAIAREIIEFHGGRIWAESRQEQGARICFVLPLAAPRELSGRERS